MCHASRQKQATHVRCSAGPVASPAPYAGVLAALGSTTVAPTLPRQPRPREHCRHAGRASPGGQRRQGDSGVAPAGPDAEQRPDHRLRHALGRRGGQHALVARGPWHRPPARSLAVRRGSGKAGAREEPIKPGAFGFPATTSPNGTSTSQGQTAPEYQPRSREHWPGRRASRPESPEGRRLRSTSPVRGSIGRAVR